MKGRFWHSSSAVYLFTVPMLVFLFAAVYAVTDVRPFWEFGLFTGLFLLNFVGAVLSVYAPFWFEADDSSVVFKELIPLRKRTISYADIKSIEVTRQYISLRNERRIEETVIFHLSGRTVKYTQDSLGIDLQRCSDDLNDIKDELYNSNFSRLKRYIESKMNTKEEN